MYLTVAKYGKLVFRDVKIQGVLAVSADIGVPPTNYVR